jgi:hypothetical protein
LDTSSNNRLDLPINPVAYLRSLPDLTLTHCFCNRYTTGTVLHYVQHKIKDGHLAILKKLQNPITTEYLLYPNFEDEKRILKLMPHIPYVLGCMYSAASAVFTYMDREESFVGAQILNLHDDPLLCTFYLHLLSGELDTGAIPKPERSSSIPNAFRPHIPPTTDAPFKRARLQDAPSCGECSQFENIWTPDGYVPFPKLDELSFWYKRLGEHGEEQNLQVRWKLELRPEEPSTLSTVPMRKYLGLPSISPQLHIGISVSHHTVQLVPVCDLEHLSDQIEVLENALSLICKLLT